MANKKHSNPKQRVTHTGENIDITFSFSKDEYTMIKRVADRRKRSIRSVMLRMFYDLDFRQEKKEYLR